MERHARGRRSAEVSAHGCSVATALPIEGRLELQHAH